jgi:hypothetical protein
MYSSISAINRGVCAPASATLAASMRHTRCTSVTSSCPLARMILRCVCYHLLPYLIEAYETPEENECG